MQGNGDWRENMRIYTSVNKKNPDMVDITMWDNKFMAGKEVYVASCTMPGTAKFTELESWMKKAVEEEKRDGIYAI